VIARWRVLFVFALGLVFALGPVPQALSEGADSLAGRFLVAEPGMPDPRFAETVVYLMSHDADGAFGLIVNRPLGRVLPEDIYDRLGIVAPDAAAPIVFHFGGPVQGEVGFVLHSPEFVVDETIAVNDGLAVSGIRVVLEAVSDGAGPARAIFALVYAGWGPGQLEREMARRDWITVDGDPAIVFDLPFAERWAAAIRRRGLDL
jgi:putative transcriptional regulator